MKNLKIVFPFALLILFTACRKCDDIEKEIPCVPSSLINNVIAFYPFTNSSIDDFSGNNNHLTNSTTASSTTDRNRNDNCAFEFDFLSGTNEFLSTSNTADLDNLINFSISLWYQPLEQRNSGFYELLIGRGLDFEQWNLGLYDCRKASFSWTSSVWDNDPNFDCGTSDLNNDWHHIVATFDDSTKVMKLYRNGILQETSDVIYNQNANHIEDLFIGNEFTGKIDDIIIFDISLNQTNVDALLNTKSCCD